MSTIVDISEITMTRGCEVSLWVYLNDAQRLLLDHAPLTFYGNYLLCSTVDDMTKVVSHLAPPFLPKTVFCGQNVLNFCFFLPIRLRTAKVDFSFLSGFIFVVVSRRVLSLAAVVMTFFERDGGLFEQQLTGRLFVENHW